MLKRICLLLCLVLPAGVVSAQDSSQLEALSKALQMKEIFAVMNEEGIAYGQEIDQSMLGGKGGDEWEVRVREIYADEKVWALFFPRFTAELEGQDISEMVAFFESDQGRRIILLEVSARRALLDETLEEASRENLREMTAEGHPRLAMLYEFVKVNDLVEFNVTGALNANLAFFNGMMDGNAFDYEMTEAEILADVWAQEDDIRVDTEEWIYSYLAMAYQPLSDDDLQAYIDFSVTKAGQQLNAALFAGFDDMFRGISRALGASVASFMQGEDI